MLSADETDRIKLKAIQQAFRLAGLAKTIPDPLLPMPDPWPFKLTEDDKAFLRSLPYPISPA